MDKDAIAKLLGEIYRTGYESDKRAIVKLCNTHLDQSGDLLKRVRDVSKQLKRDAGAFGSNGRNYGSGGG